MTDNLNDFFSDNAQWVDDTSAGSSFDAALPPQPPKSRRDMRKRREQQRRRRYVTIIAAAVVVILVVVGGFFGVRMVKHLRQMNANGSQIQIEDYTGSGDKDTTFTVETGQGAAEIARNLVKADIVKSESAFTSAVAAAGATLYPGSYALKTHMKAARCRQDPVRPKQGRRFRRSQGRRTGCPMSSPTRPRCQARTCPNSKRSSTVAARHSAR